MIRVKEVEAYPYDPKTYGLLKSRRRLTRIRFSAGRHKNGPRAWRHEDTGERLQPLLPEIYERLRKSPYAPLPWPERVTATWNEEDQEFVIHGLSLVGFGVIVFLEHVADDHDDGTPELAHGATAALHGSELPSLGR